MARNHEEIKVGLVVVVAGLLFLSALVFVGGVNVFRRKKVTYTTHFKFAGGLEPGAFVRFGGLKVGTVQAAEIDPSDSTRVRVKLLLASGTPVRVSSQARISSLGLLGENYVEISPGSRQAVLLHPGSEIPAAEMAQLADVFANVNNITLNGNRLVNDLDEKLLVLANNANQLITSLNAVVSPENRHHFESTLANADAMLADSRPQVKKTLANLETASTKLSPTIENANTLIGRADTLAGNLNTVIVENRKEIHEVLLRLYYTLADARHLMGELDDTLVSNRENLDETLENIRASSQNLKQFTDTIKQRPFSLIRTKAEKDRVPPLGK